MQEVGHESDTPIEERLGLHFDLTVPLSRYVVEHSGALAFPFKRWQIQKVWRGERPQEGRFREFVQADIDVIGAGDLPDHYEVELPLVMVSALEELRAYGLPRRPPCTPIIASCLRGLPWPWPDGRRRRAA